MKKSLFILTIGTFFLFACGKEDDPTLDAKKAAINNYSAIVLATYEDSYSTAVSLKSKIDAFVASPSATGFEDCKKAWLAARNPYGQTEAFRFYGGPIDSEEGPEGLINAWPMDENFIDYVQGNANAGLINDPIKYPNITKQLLRDLNEKISETSIFTGYHAIEFLLWGQDFSTTSAGNRPYTDYVTGAGGTAKNQARRGEYLKTVAELLVEHLAEVRDAWKSGAKYRTDFENADVSETLGKIFTGLGELSKGELAGERMKVAVESKDQENEHSCFADNTIADIKMNFLSLKNVYTGSYKRVDNSVVTGESFSNITTGLNSAKNKKVLDLFATAELKINAIPTPFDQSIIKEQAKILEATAALEKLSDAMADVALTLKVKY